MSGDWVGSTLNRKSRLGRNSARTRERYARNFGAESERIRGTCIVAREAERLGITDAEAVQAGWTPCRGAYVIAHAVAIGMGGADGGRFQIFDACQGHHDEASEERTSRREQFCNRYGIDVIAEADRIALEHPEPLGIRGMVRRWAEHQGFASDDDRDHRMLVHPSIEEGAATAPLDTYEREALMGWVRRRMERNREQRTLARISAVSVELDLPSPPLDDCNQDAAVLAVALAIGGPLLGSDESVDLAWSICEAAGWPS